MDSTLVLFVTRTGNCRRLAEKVASRFGCQALEIVDLVDRKGAAGFMKAGAQAARGESTPIEDPLDTLGMEGPGTRRLEEASRLILVQPMWAFTVCPPLRTWLDKHRHELSGKKVGLLTSQFGTPTQGMVKRFEEEYVKLHAFQAIPERNDEAAKDRALEAFLEAMEQ